MTIYNVEGSTKLAGEVELQGAKNSALKHLIIPLLTNDKFTLHNVPNISSSINPTKIVELQGGEVDWADSNTVHIDTSEVKSSVSIPHDLFFHTSGGILVVPILATKYGQLEIEKPDANKETGGDQIGRSLDLVNNTLGKLGIANRETEKSIIYELSSSSALDYEIPNRSFGVSVMALFTSLLRKGRSKFYRPTRNNEFQDILLLVRKMGGIVKYSEEVMIVEGSKKLKGVEYHNIYDKHDFISFLSAALCTESEITIKNVQYEKMRLDCLDDFIRQTGVKLEFDEKKDVCHICNNKLSDLNPVNLIASEYPNFVTEWQVLLSPFFALIGGKSEITEGIFSNRMRHWEELKKFGAKYRYQKHKDYPEEDGNPRAVKVSGGVQFKGASVVSRDVRCGAACIIAALAAKGMSQIIDKEDHIKRGYERLEERLNSIGAKITN